MKRIMVAALTLALLLTLAGCQCDHQWTEADCLTPKTCAKCGETEGQPLGHSWAEATCQAPRTCTRCALTEGEKIDHSWQAATCEAPETCAVCGLTQREALGHSWKDANYQDPETCTTCGATQGAPLEADFEKYGLAINLWENKHYNEDGSYDLNDPEDGFPYVTSYSGNGSKKATGALYVSNYRIFSSDETHQALEGYEWRAFDVEIVFSGDDLRNRVMTVAYCHENYYAIEDWDNGGYELTGTPWEYLLDGRKLYIRECFPVSFHGEAYPVAVIAEGSGFSGWHTEKNEADGTTTSVEICSLSFYACVPVGYDGVVIGFRDSGVEWEDGMYIYDVANETTLFFRLGDTQA